MSDKSRTNEELLDALGGAERSYERGIYFHDAVAERRGARDEARAAVLSRMSSPPHDRAMAEGGWQDIASAPKDGTCVLCVEFDEPQKVVDMHWFSDGVHGSWRGAVGQYRRPLKWCELPAPPTPTTKEETDK